MEKMERMLTQRAMMKCGCSGGNNTRFFHGTKVNCIMATRCLRKSVQSVITVCDNEMALNNGCFDTHLIKEEKWPRLSITASHHVPDSRGTGFQRQQMKQPGFNCLFSFRKMDAIKLEMNKNDQFKMMKRSSRFTPHLSKLSLDGWPIAVLFASPVLPFSLNGWVKN